MSDDKVDYGEVFCEAVDTIIAKRLSGLEFDVTKTCRVIDDTYKKQGKYTVTDNSVKFEAYSTLTTLNVNDSVLVNIPSGDYSKQKTILNKVVGNDVSTSFNYKSPLQNLLKLTDNIIEEQYREEFSILANDKSGDENSQVVTICEIKREDFAEYEKMGISVNIKTWLSHFNVTSGVYGLRFEFFTRDGADRAAYSYDFNVNDMVGDPYGFNTYIKQEKVFNTSYLSNVDTLIISLYQQNNFIDEDGKYIPWTYGDDGLSSRKLNNNIFIKDLNIFFGSDVGEFTQDTLQISTPNSRSYSVLETEEKIINFKWIHKVDDNTFEVLDKEKLRTKIVEIYWCRYTLGAKESPLVAEWCGPNWSTKESNLREADGDLDNPFKRVLIPDGTNTEQERIKVVCRLQDDNGEWHLYESKVLDFINTSYVYDQKTIDKVAGLSIDFMDESDGNYFIYNQNGEIINEGKGQGYLRKLIVKFDGKDITTMESRLGKLEKIEWILPIDNETSQRGTMLTYKPAWYEGAVQNEAKTNMTVTRTIDVGKSFAEQNYSIKNNWHEANSNNIITCRLSAGNQIYTKSVELNFSKVGNSGTNITLRLDYENDDNAFEIKDDGTAEPCFICASMYDMSGSRITSSVGTWDWQWYHSSEDDSSIVNYLTINQVKAEDGQVIPNRIELTKSENFDIITPEDGYNIPDNNFHILKATFTPEATDTQVTTTLTAYMPIAIKHSSINYMEGTRNIIYGSDGTLTQSTYTDAYILYNSIGPEENVIWALNWDNTDEDGEEEIQIPETYGPSLQDLVKNGITYKALKPSPLFVQGYNDRACVYAYKQIEENGPKIILWSQPLLITQSQYDFAMVNDWTGGAQVGDKFIMATALGAGKKDPETNTFSGIIIGDLKQAIQAQSEDSSSKYEKINTGLFGISNGTVSFSLTDDGVASFGKLENSGHAEFGGTTNMLYDKRGTLLDIDNGILDLTYNNTGLYLSKFATNDQNEESSVMYFKAGNVNLINFDSTGRQINSLSNNLSIDLNNGQLVSKHSSSQLIINPDDTSALKVKTFLVNWDGSINIGTKLRITATGDLYYDDKELTELIKELATATPDKS